MFRTCSGEQMQEPESSISFVFSQESDSGHHGLLPLQGEHAFLCTKGRKPKRLLVTGSERLKNGITWKGLPGPVRLCCHGHQDNSNITNVGAHQPLAGEIALKPISAWPLIPSSLLASSTAATQKPCATELLPLPTHSACQPSL